ncbi:MAG TPA: hypothetical protein VLT91_06305 [Rhizomicrobium sp.]|nr:hypothetical protein [Rhizomicrobium sp.]
MLRKPAIVLTACILGLTATSAFAADQTPGPGTSALAPGDAAGVKKAEAFAGNTGVLIAGGALVVGGIVLVASGGNGHSHPTTTSTGSKP